MINEKYKAALEAQKSFEYAQRKYEAAKESLDDLGLYLNIKRLEYRVAEAGNVVSALLERNDISDDVKTILTHCLNCLNGNIDGSVMDHNHMTGACSLEPAAKESM